MHRFDNADVVGHIYRQLARQGYAGIPIHNLFRSVALLEGWPPVCCSCQRDWVGGW